MKTPDFLRNLQRHPKYAPLLQFVKFGLVGVSNTLISLLVYYLCYYALHFPYQLSNFLGFLVSVINAYFWNQRFVFAKEGGRTPAQHAQAFAKTLATYGFTYLLSAALLYVYVEKIHISEGIAPLLNLLVTIPTNFLLNKLWTFRDSKQKKEKP